MKIKGKVTDVAIELFTDNSGNDRKKQIVVVKQSREEHADSLALCVYDENIDRFNLQVGTEYDITFDSFGSISPRRDRAFNDLKVWKAEKIQ